MEIRPFKTDEEIRKAIKDEWGDYESYRRAQFVKRPAPEAEPVEKSDTEKNAQYVEYLAKAAGLSVSEFCARNPDVYRRYQQLSYAK
jgi:hypothetical protein